MEVILNLVIIGVICVFVIDYSGFIENIEKYVSSLVGHPVKIPKPFSCSLCSSFWAGIIYLIAINQFSFLNLFFVVLNCSMTKVYLHIIYTMREFFDRILFLFDRLTGIE